MTRSLRIVLDVNVWVNSFLASYRGLPSSAAQRLTAAVVAGQCRTGALDLLVSHVMLDTLEGVLERCGVSADLAAMARDVVETAASIPPIGVLGGGVQPMRDIEDLGVLETALAGRADLLVTNNIRDFAPGSRSDIDADLVRRTFTGEPDVLSVFSPQGRENLVVTTVFSAHAWLIDGRAPPEGVLDVAAP